MPTDKYIPKRVVILYKQSPDTLQDTINNLMTTHYLVGQVSAVRTVNGLLWYATMQMRFEPESAGKEQP